MPQCSFSSASSHGTFTIKDHTGISPKVEAWNSGTSEKGSISVIPSQAGEYSLTVTGTGADKFNDTCYCCRWIRKQYGNFRWINAANISNVAWTKCSAKLMYPFAEKICPNGCELYTPDAHLNMKKQVLLWNILRIQKPNHKKLRYLQNYWKKSPLRDTYGKNPADGKIILGVVKVR